MLYLEEKKRQSFLKASKYYTLDTTSILEKACLILIKFCPARFYKNYSLCPLPYSLKTSTNVRITILLCQNFIKITFVFQKKCHGNTAGDLSRNWKSPLFVSKLFSKSWLYLAKTTPHLAGYISVAGSKQRVKYAVTF